MGGLGCPSVYLVQVKCPLRTFPSHNVRGRPQGDDDSRPEHRNWVPEDRGFGAEESRTENLGPSGVGSWSAEGTLTVKDAGDPKGPHFSPSSRLGRLQELLPRRTKEKGRRRRPRVDPGGPRGSVNILNPPPTPGDRGQVSRKPERTHRRLSRRYRPGRGTRVDDRAGDTTKGQVVPSHHVHCLRLRPVEFGFL